MSREDPSLRSRIETARENHAAWRARWVRDSLGSGSYVPPPDPDAARDRMTLLEAVNVMQEHIDNLQGGAMTNHIDPKDLIVPEPVGLGHPVPEFFRIFEAASAAEREPVMDIIALDQARKEGYLAGKQEMQAAIDRANDRVDALETALIRAHEGKAEALDRAEAALSVESVEAELHRVQCMNAKHRSRFTGQCRSAANIARGLQARAYEDADKVADG